MCPLPQEPLESALLERVGRRAERLSEGVQRLPACALRDSADRLVEAVRRAVAPQSKRARRKTRSIAGEWGYGNGRDRLGMRELVACSVSHSGLLSRFRCAVGEVKLWTFCLFHFFRGEICFFCLMWFFSSSVWRRVS